MEKGKKEKVIGTCCLHLKLFFYLFPKAFTGRLGTGQTKPMAGYLHDMVFGISANHSTMLSEIGRALDEDAKLITTEMRLSRNLVNQSLEETAVRERYLKAVKPYVRDAVIALDFSEIRKDYSEKQEWLCGIWDNSRHEKAKGYWLLTIEAIDSERRHFPLWLEPFSQNAPGYESQAKVVQNSLKQVVPYVGKNCTWVLDRGFDGSRYIEVLEKADITYAIRQVGKRTVVTENGEKISTADLAANLPTPHFSKWYKVEKGHEYPAEFSYGSALITFPKDGIQRRLVVVRQSRYKDPLILLTNNLSGSHTVWAKIAKAYFQRWGVEEGIRLVKQIFDLENVRAMSFMGIRRLTLFAYLAYGFICLFARRVGKKALSKILKTYKSFGETPHFLYYRVANSMSMALMRAGP